MHSLQGFIKRLVTSSAVVVLAGFSLVPFSATAAADCDPTPPPDSSYGNGVHHPVGADAGMFTYDCNSGTWTSQYYTYYPASNSRVATYAPNYSYDCASGVWYMNEYDFSSGDGAYHLNRVATGDPGLATGCPAPVSSSAPNTSGSAPAAASTAPTTSDGSTIANTGPGSNNGTAGTITLNGTTTNNTGFSLNNGVYSNATTGNTFVIGNTTGGSASSGNAQSVANIANLLQSSTNAFGAGTAVFTANINGDVNGDFMFDPSAILATGPGSTNVAANNLTVNTNDTNNTNAQINNNINVGASSGNATVASNTTGGDATTGTAQAIVNLMNLINSTVAAGHSFIGTININGNLNGDILLPQGMIDQLLASTGPGSNNAATTSLTDNSTTLNNIKEAVANNITSSATSGNASVAGNTSAGSATSGSAGTNVTVLNLTGSNTIGKNDLLVFVNVLGKWVGMIVNAPTGSTAASLGGGITSSGPGSSNTLANNVTDNSTTTNNANLGITNNVNVHANSGNANVTNNTTGGNATSGNANTAVNILNLEGSNLSLSNWFGVLFINVFGAWTGSFGINTSAGDPISNPTNNPVQANTQQSFVAAAKQFANFAPHTSSGGSNAGGTTTNDSSPTSAAVLGTTTSVAKKVATAAALPTPDNRSHASFFLPALGVGLAALILLASERGRFFGKRQ